MNNTEASASSELRLALIGIGHNEATQIWNTVGRFMTNEIAIDVSTRADMAVFDIEARSYKIALHDWQANHPGAPALVLASTPSLESTDIIYIRKPVNVSELMAALNRAADRVREKRDADMDRVSVDVCMLSDPVHVLDTIGIGSDVFQNLRFAMPTGSALPATGSTRPNPRSLH